MTKKECILWIGSLILLVGTEVLAGNIDTLTTVAAFIGITSLIFAAQGNVWSPVLMVVFCILYGIISYEFRYWGELITYVFMSLPMAVWSIYTWMKNSNKGGRVKIRQMTGKLFFVLCIITIAVTVVFYVILKLLHTPNLIFSTISVSTSFLAASFTLLRSSYYALGYAANDLVLIVLWLLASMQDLGYLPVAMNFFIFFVNDMYGFICWKKREKKERFRNIEKNREG